MLKNSEISANFSPDLGKANNRISGGISQLQLFPSTNNGLVKKGSSSINLSESNNTTTLKLINQMNNENKEIEFNIVDYEDSNLYTFNNTEISYNNQNDKNTNIIIMDYEIENAPKLYMIDVEGNLLRNQVVYIDASGMKDGLRNARDGLSYFGFEEEFNVEI